jgi:hypothetical protein
MTRQGTKFFTGGWRNLATSSPVRFPRRVKARFLSDFRADSLASFLPLGTLSYTCFEPLWFRSYCHWPLGSLLRCCAKWRATGRADAITNTQAVLRQPWPATPVVTTWRPGILPSSKRTACGRLLQAAATLSKSPALRSTRRRSTPAPAASQDNCGRSRSGHS